MFRQVFNVAGKFFDLFFNNKNKLLFCSHDILVNIINV